MLQKNLFRRHQLQKAMQWKDALLAGEDNIVSYYLALNSSFPQVQKQPLDLLQFSREEEEKAEEDDENHSQESLSPRQCHSENLESPMLVPSQEDEEDDEDKEEETNLPDNPSGTNDQKSPDKEYFVSLSCDNDFQIPPLQLNEDVKPSSSQLYSSATPQSANLKYGKSTGMKLKKDRKQGRSQPLKKSKKASLPSFSQSKHFPNIYKGVDDEDEDLFHIEKDYNQPVNLLERGMDSPETIIKEIKKVTSSHLPNDEKVNLVQSLLSMLQLQSPTDTPTDGAYLMSLQEIQPHRPRLNSITCRSISGAVSKTTASLPSKTHHSHHHHHHHHHPRVTRTKNRKSSLIDSRGKVSRGGKWDLGEKNQFVSPNPMICSCIQLNCGHNNLLRLQDDYLSHSMHNLGRDEVIYDKLSDTVSLTKEHDSYPNLNNPENLMVNTACRAYNNRPCIPSNFVHRPHMNECPGRPPSPMAVSPGRGMNYVTEWMNCSGAADGLAEDLNTVSLYSPSWDTCESQQ